MTAWQAWVFLGIAAVIVGGFAWYERARPPARLVALVAALAALAVAGRLVLAPVPNVVATTDIALISGYALGPAPGFAVGALAAPISNIWLGQGPWTAWQMAGWGLVGIGGAALAGLTARRLGRWGLAAACGAAGLAYGALLDFSVMASYGGEQSLDRYLALSARAIPFNIAHAAGNVAFAMVAGPALVRMISRYRTRLEFSWRPAASAAAVILALALVPAQLAAVDAPAQATERSVARSAAGAASAWLAAEQNRDGGFGATPGQPSSPAMTGWVILGLEAAGRNPLDVGRGGRNPIAYLRSRSGRLRSVGDLERTILALEGAGIASRGFAGHDLVAELRDRRSGDGSVSGQVNLTAFYVLAMRAAGVDAAALDRSSRWLRRAQNRDGGWGFRPDAPSDPDSTGAALQALGAGGGGASGDGARFLRRVQRGDGGWALATSGAVNAQSTAWAVQGLVAAGESGPALRRGVDYLARLRSGDGHYRYSRSSDQTPIWVTAQALLAVEREALPIAAVERRRGGRDRARANAQNGASRPPASSERPSTTAGPGDRGAGAGDAGGGAEGDGSRSGPGRRAGAGEARSDAGVARPAGGTAIAGGDASRPVAARELLGEAAVAEDDSSTGVYVLGGLALLAIALAGGFLWYRRGPSPGGS